MASKPDALSALEMARKASSARAKEAALAAPPEPKIDDTLEDCAVQLVVYMFTYGLKVGMGVMPDGMAIFIRLSMPRGLEDERAGMVAFVVHNDPTEVYRKAILALQASARSAYWKPDRFAQSTE
jgi:hypothetical protein